MTRIESPQRARALSPRVWALTAGVLSVLVTLWTLCGAAAASSATDTPARSLCPALGRGHAACTSAAPILRGSDSEVEEGEEEARGGEEEAAASTEARAEEAGSSPGDSPSNRSAGPSSKPGPAPAPTPAENLAIVSQLKLSTRATASLRQHAPQASSIGFSFTLSASTQVKVTLLKQTNGAGGKRWTTLPDSLTVSAGKGRVSRSLSGHNRLSPGRYRLTVKPAGGDPCSIYLSARR